MLINDFANSVKFGTAPFKLPQRPVDMERQVNQDQASGIKPYPTLCFDATKGFGINRLCCVTYQIVAEVVMSATASSSQSKNVPFEE